jgi:hypothetical protein
MRWKDPEIAVQFAIIITPNLSQDVGADIIRPYIFAVSITDASPTSGLQGCLYD